MTTKNPSDYKRGVAIAAEYANEYNGSTTHRYRLGDCILAKFNIRKGRPRRNQRAIQLPVEAWLAGYAVALADAQRRIGASTIVCEMARDVGLTLKEARRIGVDPYDVKALRRAGVR